MKLSIFKCLACILFLSTPIAGQSQTVSINNGQGHGFIFRHAGKCYAILPHHVHPSDGPFSASLPNRAEPGLGFVQFKRPEADLAVAELTGSLTQFCTVTWSELIAASGKTPGPGTVDVLRISRQGDLQNAPMKLDGVAWEALAREEGQTAGHHRYLRLSTMGEAVIHPGTSGAFVFWGSNPIGMVLNAIPPNRVRALALEEIADPVGRWLNSRVVTTARAGAVAEPSTGIPFEVVGFRAVAPDPQHSALALQNGGTYRYSGQTTENAIEIDFPSGTVALGKLVVGRVTPIQHDGITTPTRIIVRTKAGDVYSPYTSKSLPANGSVVEISLPVRTDGLLLELSGSFGPTALIEFGPLTIEPYE